MSLLFRKLRRDQTEPERMLWAKLRNRQLGGVKFRRQHPMGAYIVDIVCLERKLVIELDGKQHRQQRTYDDERTRLMESRGFRVVRFRNIDVYGSLNNVLSQIEAALAASNPK